MASFQRCPFLPEMSFSYLPTKHILWIIIRSSLVRSFHGKFPEMSFSYFPTKHVSWVIIRSSLVNSFHGKFPEMSFSYFSTKHILWVIIRSSLVGSFLDKFPLISFSYFSTKHIQSTLIISNSLILNNRLSRSENLVRVLKQRSTNRQQNIVEKRTNSPLFHNIFNISP